MKTSKFLVFMLLPFVLYFLFFVALNKSFTITTTSAKRAVRYDDAVQFAMVQKKTAVETTIFSSSSTTHKHQESAVLLSELIPIDSFPTEDLITFYTVLTSREELFDFRLSADEPFQLFINGYRCNGSDSHCRMLTESDSFDSLEKLVGLKDLTLRGNEFAFTIFDYPEMYAQPREVSFFFRISPNSPPKYQVFGIE